ncbi:MAG: hypothetical protein J3Q66DRAFT_339632 [Benniella sp.]|nr:MAG: hypothetical protein J3Q66DRAFT_339632 [Benniella sp.]
MMGPAITTIASDRERRARAQQHYRSRGSSVGSQGGGSVGSPRSPRNGKEISITAIANNSGDEELIRKSQRRRASSGANRKPNILALPFFQQPQPQPQVQQQQQAQQQPQQNRLSVQSIQSLQSARSRARSESTSAVMSPYQASRLARPQSQLMFGPGYERADLGTGTASPLLRVQQQSSPMSPGTMTASGTVLKQGRDRRRSISVYPNSSANTRRKELLGNAQTSPDETPHYVLVGGNASSGYFGTSHHGAQSPFGFARGPTMASSSAAIGASRSCVNTPSRNGRLSRISVGAGQPQTLAREMEQRQPPQHAGFKA